MNERIKKLANIWASRRFEENGKIYYTFPENALEVFAGELVKECSDLMYSHAHSLDQYRFTDKANTAKTCGGMVLEHFGLKEKHDTSN